MGFRVLDAFRSFCCMKEFGDVFDCVNFSTLIHIVTETAIVSFRRLPVELPLPTISENSLYTLFCSLIIDHGVLLEISISVPKIIISNFFLDTSFLTIVFNLWKSSPIFFWWSYKSNTVLSFSSSRILSLYNPSKMSSGGIFVIDNEISSHFESNSWISSFRRQTVKVGIVFDRIMDSNDPEVIVDHSKQSVCLPRRKRSCFWAFCSSGLILLLKWELWMILFSADAIFESNTSTLNSSCWWRRCQITHWINHLHFFDPMHGFRKKLWTSTYLSLESYLSNKQTLLTWWVCQKWRS